MQRPGGATSSFARSSNGMRSAGGAPNSNRSGMNGNGGEGGTVVKNGGGGQVQLQRQVVAAQQQNLQQQQQRQNPQQQNNQQQDGNLQQGMVSMDDGEFTVIYLGGGGDGLPLGIAFALGFGIPLLLHGLIMAIAS